MLRGREALTIGIFAVPLPLHCVDDKAVFLPFALVFCFPINYLLFVSGLIVICGKYSREDVAGRSMPVRCAVFDDGSRFFKYSVPPNQNHLQISSYFAGGFDPLRKFVNAASQ